MANEEFNIEDKEKEFFSKVEVEFESTKEDVWASLESKINFDNPPKKVKVFSLSKIAIAASVALLISVGLLNSIEKDITTNEIVLVELPDNSIVTLDKGSTMSYKPYMWWWNRKLKMEGKGFFEVKKGSKFSVVSNAGATAVLGTSFNISTLEGKYEVVCKTGKVKVESGNSKNIITPNQAVFVSENGDVKLKNVEADDFIFWRIQKYKFSSTPIKKVAQILARDYKTEIVLSGNTEMEISLVAPKNTPLEELLLMIKETVGGTLTKKEGRYILNVIDIDQ